MCAPVVSDNALREGILWTSASLKDDLLRMTYRFHVNLLDSNCIDVFSLHHRYVISLFVHPIAPSYTLKMSRSWQKLQCSFKIRHAFSRFLNSIKTINSQGNFISLRYKTCVISFFLHYECIIIRANTEEFFFKKGLQTELLVCQFSEE